MEEVLFTVLGYLCLALLLAWAVYEWLYYAPTPTKKLLILDLNNLLVARVYAPSVAEEHPYALDYVSRADVLHKHFTWKREHLREFLDYCFAHFTVAVWSSAWRMNVDLLCEYIFQQRRGELLFEWSQEHCTVVSPHPDPQITKKPLFEKNLSTVWDVYPEYNAENTVILDDSDLKMRNNIDCEVGICERWGPWNTGKVETLFTIQRWLEERE